jgi:hypothetical protein
LGTGGASLLGGGEVAGARGEGACGCVGGGAIEVFEGVAVAVEAGGLGGVGWEGGDDEFPRWEIGGLVEACCGAV